MKKAGPFNMHAYAQSRINLVSLIAIKYEI